MTIGHVYWTAATIFFALVVAYVIGVFGSPVENVKPDLRIEKEGTIR